MKFTFKRGPRERGLARIANPWPSVDIKLGGVVCGWIQPRSSSSPTWSIYFQVSTPQGGWINTLIRSGLESEADARRWITDHNDELQSQYKLYVEPKGRA